jgi:ketosteroid isomerase-like protein
MNRAATLLLFFTSTLTLSAAPPAQTLTPQPVTRAPAINPITMPQLTPGQVELIGEDGKFAQDVAKHGGKAFDSWFADDAVELSNGKAPTLGKRAIVASANWDPADYQLTWFPEGAQMGPSGDAGFTWGHFDSVTKDRNGQSVTLGGRYITFWKKVDGKWKVALDAGANDAPAAGDCCSLPKP